MSRAALNILGQDPDGFYLMIEGGAVDWANHDKQTAPRPSKNNRTLITPYRPLSTGSPKTINSRTPSSSSPPTTNAAKYGAPRPASAARPPSTCPEPKAKARSLPPNIIVPATPTLWSLFTLAAPHCEEFLWLTRGTDVAAARSWGYSGSYVDNTDVFKVMMKAIGK